ncbi:MAG: hypothetical protein AB7V55_00600 [Oscillospiraceae bacterium]
MLAIRPIDEPDVVDLLNAGRFDGPVEGYIMMDGPTYLGHALFQVVDGVTTVLDSSVKDETLLDGIVRTCVAAGDNRGAKHFAVNAGFAPLAKWWGIHCKGVDAPAPVEHIFTFC